MATAGDVMDMAAALQNDVNKDRYSYAVQLPYLKIAWRTLCSYLQANDVPVLNEVSGSVAYTANATTITKPSDLFIPFELFERASGSTDDNAWTELIQRRWEPLAEADPNNIGFWAWREQELVVRACSSNREVKIRYAKTIESQLDSGSAATVNVDNATNYLGYATGELLAAFVGVNPGRAAALNAKALEERDLILTITTKKNQFQRVRRKGYRIGRGPLYLPRQTESS